MSRRWLLLLVIVPLTELALLTELTRRTSLLTTVTIVILTGVTGIQLVRWQGWRAWRAISQQLAVGRLPSREILEGVLILLAGVLLLTPGPLTDLVGFLLLVPPLRRRLGSWLQTRLLRSGQAAFHSQVWVSGAAGADWSAATEAATEDQSGRAQVRVVDPDAPRLPPDSPSS